MNQEAHDLGVKLAGMKQKCPNCEGGLVSPQDQWQECPDCHGTGEVYVLDDTIRVLCPGCSGKGNLLGFYNAACPSCDGRGWNPPEDFMTWCWALNGAENDVAPFFHEEGFSIQVIARRTGERFRDAERLLTLLAQKEQA